MYYPDMQYNFECVEERIRTPSDYLRLIYQSPESFSPIAMVPATTNVSYHQVYVSVEP